ncbi:MAG: Cof subfamily protein (haloacid dehalogenase superfamily) [Cellvibrionaceae bacterium]|jgi:Cof subfamily protein (haloacid dehalogenase superfamily)
MTSLENVQIHRLNHFNPSLIFFDIDGTLLDTQGNYSFLLKRELERLSRKDVRLAIASGRPAIAAQFLFDELPLTDAGLFCTGAEIYNPKKRQHLQLHYFTLDDIKQLNERVEFHNVYCEYYTRDFYTEGNDGDIASIHSEHLRVVPKCLTFTELLNKNIPITKLLLGVNKKKNEGILEKLAIDFSQLEFSFAHFLARPDWLFASVVCQSANKATGFKQLLEFHHVTPNQVMAFGDSHSDILFLEKAGLGIAMGNANDNVKSAANMSTLSADENGVAKALSQILI